MKNWNTVGKIKAVILGFLFIPNLIVAPPSIPSFGFVQYLMPLLFGAFAIPMIVKLNNSIGIGKIEKPNWNDNPLKLSRPLVFFQFAAWFMIVTGASITLGSAIQHQIFQTFGLTAILFGIGILIGIKLTIHWFDK